MKRFILSIMSLAAVMILGIMPSYLPTAYAVSRPSKTVFKSVVPKVLTEKIDGTVTLWSDVLIGFSSPKVDPIHISAKFVPDLTKGVWDITVTNLSIPWNSSTTLVLQKGKVASGILQPLTGASTLVIPLQNAPMVNTIQFNLSTNSRPPIKTTSGNSIHGSSVTTDKKDKKKGDFVMVGSQSGIGPLKNNVQVCLQGTLSLWPLPSISPAKATKATKKPL